MTKQMIAALVIGILAASQSAAHAILVSATPEVNGTIEGPKVHIRLRFNARIDGSRSRLRIVLPDQSVRPLALDRQEHPGTLDSEVTGLSSGAYRLQWQVLAGDGHITRGEVPFQVK